MKRQNVKGQILVDEDANDENSERLLDTEIGLFSIEDGLITGHISPSQQNYMDLNSLEQKDSIEVEFILPDGFKMCYTKEVSDSDIIHMNTGEKLLIDMSITEDILGIDSENEEIAVEIQEIMRVNESGSQKDALEFLGTDYEYDFVKDDTSDIPSRHVIFKVGRCDENQVRQEAIIEKDTLSNLVSHNAVKKLIEI